MSEIGVSGLKESRGYILEEFHPALSGRKAVQVYRQMSDNDAIIGAILFAIGNILRAAKWEAEPKDASDAAKKEAEFVESLFQDMSHTFEDFVAEVLTMLVYGWQLSEIVLKRRVGPEETDPEKRSKFDDGRIGIRKLAPRAQDTLLQWEMQDDGGVSGFWQVPFVTTPGKPSQIFIPIERALLFRTTSRKNSPEGVSVLRTAYRSWFYATRIEEYEAIGVERELAGLPVVSLPSRYFRADASDAEKAVLESYKAIARDVKRNEQGGLVIPSDPWFDADGKPIGLSQVDIKLLSSGGARQIDINSSVNRHQTNIARSVLADFIMLGNVGHGSFALSKNKTDLFLRACETFLNNISSVINRHLLPRIWRYNNIDPALMPEYKPGRISPVDLGELGAFLRDFAAAGGELFPDQDLENYIRDEAGLPEKSPDAAASQQFQQAHDQLRTFLGTHGALNPQPQFGPDGKPIKTPPAALPDKTPINPPPPPVIVSDGGSNSSSSGGAVSKFNQNHDELGRFSDGDNVSGNPLHGADGPVIHVAHSVRTWLSVPENRARLAKGIAVGAVSIGAEIAVGYGAHAAAEAIIGAGSGGLTSVAAATALHHVAEHMGVNFETARHIAISGIDHVLGLTKAAIPEDAIPADVRAYLLALRGMFEKAHEDLTKYDPSQPRDYHGRWSDGSGIGAEFVSPNQDPTAAHTLETAYHAMSGHRQKTLRDAWHVVDNEFGHRTMTSDALGAWSDGAENSSISVTKGVDWNDLKASAAMKGYLGHQKAVLAFQQSAGGGNRGEFLASFHATGSLQDLHKSMLAHGLDYHTLSPSGNGAAVWIYGSDQKTLDAAAKAATEHGGRLSVRYGHGEFIGTQLPDTAGDAAQRADARRVYEDAIGNASRSGRDYRGIWDRVRARYGQELDLVKALLKYDPNQERDWHGRWTGEGGTAIDGPEEHKQSLSRALMTLPRAHREHVKDLKISTMDSRALARGRPQGVYHSPAGFYDLKNHEVKLAPDHLTSPEATLMHEVGHAINAKTGGLLEATHVHHAFHDEALSPSSRLTPNERAHIEPYVHSPREMAAELYSLTHTPSHATGKSRFFGSMTRDRAMQVLPNTVSRFNRWKADVL
jgi:hypothetical protein